MDKDHVLAQPSRRSLRKTASVSAHHDPLVDEMSDRLLDVLEAADQRPDEQSYILYADIQRISREYADQQNTSIKYILSAVQKALDDVRTQDSEPSCLPEDVCCLISRLTWIVKDGDRRSMTDHD